MFGTENRWC